MAKYYPGTNIPMIDTVNYGLPSGGIDITPALPRDSGGRYYLGVPMPSIGPPPSGNSGIAGFFENNKSLIYVALGLFALVAIAGTARGRR